MGYAFAEIDLSNPQKSELKPIHVRALADTGALMLCVPEHVALQLGLEAHTRREVTVADGREVEVPYVGPVQVSFDGRYCFVGALIMGDEVLLGAIAMEDMDLVVNPRSREVTVNPESPNLPHVRAKSWRPR